MGLFGGSSKTETTSDPYGPAKKGIDQHLGMIENQNPWEVYGGDQQAQFTGDQQQYMQNARDYTGQFGQGQQMTDQLMNAGQSMMGGIGGAQDYYNQAMGQGAVQNQGPDMGMAASYANSPYLQDSIDAAAGDVTRNLYENQMPGIAAYSAGSGNLGSSRRGMLEGMATRDAAGRIQGISTDMRNNAWNQGMGYANQIAQQNAGLNMQNRQNQMNAANQMSSMGMNGANLMGQGANMWGQNNQMLGNVGQMNQNYNQQGIDNAQSNYYLGQQLPYQQAGMGMNIAMQPGAAFGTQTTEGPGGPGIMDSLVGMGMQAGSAYMGGMGGR